MKKFCFLYATLAASCSLMLAADLAPALEWVKTLGGSGASSVAAATADSRGSLYIVGSTTSLDFPAVAATQSAPGGSTLARINLVSGSSSRLFPARLPSISSVAAGPATPDTLYASSRNEVWKSVDAGSTWSMLSQFPLSISVSGLAVDPTRSTILYAATSAIGVQKSIDGGVTWNAMNNGIPKLANGSIGVQSVWVDPAAPDVIFGSNSFGLMRSANGGDSWAAVAAGGPFSPLAFDPFAAGTLYYGTGNQILKSTDHGSTFAPLPSLPNEAGLIALIADPQQPGVLFGGSTAGLYESSDEGATWKLIVPGVNTVLAADAKSGAIYTNSAAGILKTTDRFANVSPVGPSQPSLVQLVVSGQNLFAVSNATTDVLVIKLGNNGNVVYSTYFGGSGSDQGSAVAVGSDGSLYVTGSTNSPDLPVTPGSYQSKPALSSRPATGFVLKLNPAGQREWATYFTESSITSIAVDAIGNPYIAGSTSGGLPTTPGAYRTDFQQTISSNGFFGVPGPTSAFVTKFNAQGTGLVYSTYVSADNQKNTVQAAGALAVDTAGNAWIGVSVNSGIAPSSGISPCVVELNAAGSAIMASAVQAGLSNVASLAFDADSNVYIAGSYAPQIASFPATPGAFQTTSQPATPMLPYQPPAGGGMDAFVAKWDSSLTHLLAATLLGGELPDVAASIAVDASGLVILSGSTNSKALPTRVPFQQSFSSRSGFIAAFDTSLSTLQFASYLGDARQFAADAAIPDGSGGLLVAGSTLNSGTNDVIANRIALVPAPQVRLDSVQNYASHIAAALAPGEPVIALGSRFGNGSQIVVDGSPLATVSGTDTSIVAVLPNTAATSGVHSVQVSNNGTVSNSIDVPAAPASPGIYTRDGSGAGQGYVLNTDGSLNSPSNPAATGSAITIFMAGEGQYTLTDGYAVAQQAPAVFIDGFYCDGIAAKAGRVEGLPGNVYQLSVLVPDPAVLVQNNPDLKNFRFPAESSIQVRMGPTDSTMLSQTGVFINIQ